MRRSPAENTNSIGISAYLKPVHGSVCITSGPAQDPVPISVPKASYVPRFTCRVQKGVRVVESVFALAN